MTSGNMTEWINRFRNVEQRFTERIVTHWPECRGVLDPSSEEDEITNNLVHRLCRDPIVRRIGWPDAQYVPLEPTGEKGAVTGKGFIDIALILLDIDLERDMYVAYECKRLNVIYHGKRSSLAKPYVTEGLHRYIKQQYSRSLPFACMLGYIMDGEVNYALNKVFTAIKAHVDDENLTSGPNELPKIGGSERFQTVLMRSDGSQFEVKHTFLSF